MSAVATARRRRPRLSTLAAWAFLIVFETLAQVALKAGGNALGDLPFDLDWLAAAASNGWIAIGVVGYLGSFVAWMVILDRTPLNLGFPLTAIIYATVAGASFVFFGEEIGAGRLVGIGLIVVGVMMLGHEDR
jgi:multidrug transporter EmrE-like cation transporter